jgi:hypothetical protein
MKIRLRRKKEKRYKFDYGSKKVDQEFWGSHDGEDIDCDLLGCWNSTLKMEAICSSETLVITCKTTLRHNQKKKLIDILSITRSSRSIFVSGGVVSVDSGILSWDSLSGNTYMKLTVNFKSVMNYGNKGLVFFRYKGGRVWVSTWRMEGRKEVYLTCKDSQVKEERPNSILPYIVLEISGGNMNSN